jgi:hypothetical protein
MNQAMGRKHWDTMYFTKTANFITPMIERENTCLVTFSAAFNSPVLSSGGFKRRQTNDINAPTSMSPGNIFLDCPLFHYSLFGFFRFFLTSLHL